MASNYRHPEFAERCRIHALLKSGLSMGAIALRLGRAKSTISRELARNSGGRGHRHRYVQEPESTGHAGASGRVPRAEITIGGGVQSLAIMDPAAIQQRSKSRQRRTGFEQSQKLSRCPVLSAHYRGDRGQ